MIGKHSSSGHLTWTPRSIEINSEMGMFVESADLTETFAEQFFTDLQMASYSVSLNVEGQLIWRYESDDTVKVIRKEPQAGFWRRFYNGFYRLLPIEG